MNAYDKADKIFFMKNHFCKSCKCALLLLKKEDSYEWLCSNVLCKNGLNGEVLNHDTECSFAKVV